MVHLSRQQGVFHQHSASQGAYTTGNRCNVGCLYSTFIVGNISTQLTFLVAVHGHVHHHSALLDHIALDEARNTESCNNDISLTNDLGKIEDTISPYILLFEIKDNPNISIDLSEVCPYIEMGYYELIYDSTQNIRGCDALNLD